MKTEMDLASASNQELTPPSTHLMNLHPQKTQHKGKNVPSQVNQKIQGFKTHQSTLFKIPIVP